MAGYAQELQGNELKRLSSLEEFADLLRFEKIDESISCIVDEGTEEKIAFEDGGFVVTNKRIIVNTEHIHPLSDIRITGSFSEFLHSAGWKFVAVMLAIGSLLILAGGLWGWLLGTCALGLAFWHWNSSKMSLIISFFDSQNSYAVYSLTGTRLERSSRLKALNAAAMDALRQYRKQAEEEVEKSRSEKISSISHDLDSIRK